MTKNACSRNNISDCDNNPDCLWDNGKKFCRSITKKYKHTLFFKQLEKQKEDRIKEKDQHVQKLSTAANSIMGTSTNLSLSFTPHGAATTFSLRPLREGGSLPSKITIRSAISKSKRVPNSKVPPLGKKENREWGFLMNKIPGLNNHFYGEKIVENFEDTFVLETARKLVPKKESPDGGFYEAFARGMYGGGLTSVRHLKDAANLVRKQIGYTMCNEGEIISPHHKNEFISSITNRLQEKLKKGTKVNDRIVKRQFIELQRNYCRGLSAKLRKPERNSSEKPKKEPKRKKVKRNKKNTIVPEYYDRTWADNYIIKVAADLYGMTMIFIEEKNKLYYATRVVPLENEYPGRCVYIMRQLKEPNQTNFWKLHQYDTLIPRHAEIKEIKGVLDLMPLPGGEVEIDKTIKKKKTHVPKIPKIPLIEYQYDRDNHDELELLMDNASNVEMGKPQILEWREDTLEKDFTQIKKENITQQDREDIIHALMRKEGPFSKLDDNVKTQIYMKVTGDKETDIYWNFEYRPDSLHRFDHHTRNEKLIKHYTPPEAESYSDELIKRYLKKFPLQNEIQRLLTKLKLLDRYGIYRDMTNEEIQKIYSGLYGKEHKLNIKHKIMIDDNGRFKKATDGTKEPEKKEKETEKVFRQIGKIPPRKRGRKSFKLTSLKTKNKKRIKADDPAANPDLFVSVITPPPASNPEIVSPVVAPSLPPADVFYGSIRKPRAHPVHTDPAQREDLKALHSASLFFKKTKKVSAASRGPK
jgi:hypothetical protein